MKYRDDSCVFGCPCISSAPVSSLWYGTASGYLALSSRCLAVSRATISCTREVIRLSYIPTERDSTVSFPAAVMLCDGVRGGST